MFFGALWPEAAAIADPDLALFDAFGVEHGRWRRAPTPRSVLQRLHEYVLGEHEGDPWRMPGAFLVDQGAVVWAHESRHAGDQPDPDAVLAIGEELARRTPCVAAAAPRAS